MNLISRVPTLSRAMLRPLPLLALAALATGCAQLGVGGSTEAPRAVQRCDAAPAQWAVGKTNSAQTIEEARKRSGALMARVLRPNQPTTMEFNAERLNLVVDTTGRITAARCG